MENIQNYPFYQYLSEDETELVRKNVSVRKAAKGEILYGHGGACFGMAYILSGSLRAYIVSEEGREISLYYLHDGDNCVMSASCVISQITFETVIAAEEDTEMLVLSSGIFAQLTRQNIYVKEFMYELATQRFSQVMWVMQEILFCGFDKRLAHYLVAEYEKTGNRELQITQEKIAQSVNSAREVVARMLKHFANEKLIAVQHGKIQLLDIEAIKKIG